MRERRREISICMCTHFAFFQFVEGVGGWACICVLCECGGGALENK